MWSSMEERLEKRGGLRSFTNMFSITIAITITTALLLFMFTMSWIGTLRLPLLYEVDWYSVLVRSASKITKKQEKQEKRNGGEARDARLNNNIA